MIESRIKIAYGWDPGLARDINEDSIIFSNFNLRTHIGIVAGSLFAVADGMGGHNAGEIASDIAVKTIYRKCMSDLFSKNIPSLPDILNEAFTEANLKILEKANEIEFQGMGTTLTTALIIGEDMYVAHIGDSRCYIINNRETLLITKDHSIVQELLDSGNISPEQALNHPNKNVITRVLGYSEKTSPDLYHIKLYSGDYILLCSDGLYNSIPIEKITEIILNSHDLDQACTELINQSNQAGGLDNISVIIAKPDNLPSWQAIISAETSVRTTYNE